MKLNLLLTIGIIRSFTSCGLKPISTEHTLLHIKNENITLNELGNGTILIYNDANILHTSDNTSRLNIIIDDKNLGQLRAKNYAIVKLDLGIHYFRINHLDVVNMKSDHQVNLTESIKILKVKPTITSNKLEIVEELPQNWKKYTYMNSN